MFFDAVFEKSMAFAAETGKIVALDELVVSLEEGIPPFLAFDVVLNTVELYGKWAVQTDVEITRCVLRMFDDIVLANADYEALADLSSQVRGVEIGLPPVDSWYDTTMNIGRVPESELREFLGSEKAKLIDAVYAYDELERVARILDNLSWVVYEAKTGRSVKFSDFQEWWYWPKSGLTFRKAF